jgi:hypothetical protein
VGGVCESGWEVSVLFAGDEPEGLSFVLGAVGWVVGKVACAGVGELRYFGVGWRRGKPG